MKHFIIVDEIAAEEHNTLEFFLLNELQCDLHLIFFRLDVPQDRRKAHLLGIIFHGPDHRIEELVRDALDKKCDRFRIALLELDRAVVRYESGLLHDLHDLLSGFRIDVRVIIERP